MLIIRSAEVATISQKCLNCILPEAPFEFTTLYSSLIAQKK